MWFFVNIFVDHHSTQTGANDLQRNQSLSSGTLHSAQLTEDGGSSPPHIEKGSFLLLA